MNDWTVVPNAAHTPDTIALDTLSCTHTAVALRQGKTISSSHTQAHTHARTHAPVR